MRTTRSRPTGQLVKATEVHAGDVIFSSGGWRTVVRVSDPYWAEDLLGDQRLFLKVTCHGWSSAYRADHSIFSRKDSAR